MVAISDSLCYQLVKGHHAFLQKRNGRSNRTGTVQFTTESGNVKNLNSSKYTGIAKTQTVDLTSVEDSNGRQVVQLTLLTGKVGKTRGASSKRSIALKKNFRRSVRSMSRVTGGNYRSDLSDDALARYAKLKAGVQVANGVKEGTKVKLGRA